jgi:hypothetical protein
LIGIFTSLRMRPEGIPHTSLVLLENIVTKLRKGNSSWSGFEPKFLKLHAGVIKLSTKT